MIVLLFVILCCLQLSAGQCTFPSGFSSSVWTSTEFGDITFGTNVAEFSEDGKSANWTCEVSSGSKYVLRSLNTDLSNSLQTNIYFYYCFEFHQQGSDSYIYYHPTALSGVKRRLMLASDTTTVDAACSEAVDTAEYHVMVRKDSASTVKYYCASPLLGDFLYSCPSSSENGTLNVCDTFSQQTLAFNHSQCSPSSPVLFSTGGVLNCVAKTSATVSSATVYYQTLYNTDASVNDLTTFQFVCLAVTEESDGQVLFSYSHTSCIAGQTSSTTDTNVAVFEPLTSTSKT
ncbi:uncharacterized protein LOC132743662 [Ruditapes philippinarum]|uniref:uncharacterized protein LOC132743662 n=1 Tax=Ruditapes philippinarum TaxID=129788 RepID=UPI00295AE70A|nr:uncharacterized protein LOC132743662 [Ruditapes philippinarum]